MRLKWGSKLYKLEQNEFDFIQTGKQLHSLNTEL